MASLNSARLFVLLLLLAGMLTSAEEVPDTPAYEFAEVEIPLIRFSESHPIEVLNFIFAEVHRIRPDLKCVSYTFVPQVEQMSQQTPMITGSYRSMAAAGAFREMTGLCNWSFFIEGNTYKFTNSREFYSPKYWPELKIDTEDQNRD